MTNAQTYIDGDETLVALAAGDIVTKNTAGYIAKVAAAASTTALGVVYSGVSSSVDGKKVSFVKAGKAKVYTGVATNGTAIEVGTPLEIGTGSTRGAGQVLVAAASDADATRIVGRALEAVALDTTEAQEVLIEAEVNFQ
jgi:hypothetical protein